MLTLLLISEHHPLVLAHVSDKVAISKCHILCHNLLHMPVYVCPNIDRAPCGNVMNKLEDMVVQVGVMPGRSNPPVPKLC